MKKVLDILEQYVEWIALGLGGLFLAYMIWTYILNTPVMVKDVGPTPLPPGEVDQYIAEHPAAQLEAEMKKTGVPDMQVPKFVDQFKNDMAFTAVPNDPLAIQWTSQSQKIQLIRDHSTPTQHQQPMDHLPELAAALISGLVSGHSSLILPPPGAPPAAGGQPVVGNGVDKAWVSIGFTIPASTIAAAFNAAHVPNWCPNTSVLQVQLYRQEVGPDGKPIGEPKLIGPIEGQVTSDYPLAGNAQAQDAYSTWAQAHVGDILQPAFPQSPKGDAWHAPGTPVVAPITPQLPALEPSKEYTSKELQPYSPEQKKAYYKAHQDYLASQPKNKPAPRAPSVPSYPGRGGGMPGMPGANATPLTVGKEIYAQQMPPGMINPEGMPNPNPEGQPGQNGNFPLPPPIFDPAQLQTDIVGWAHDDTVVPGHTYRYTIVYKLKNPVYGTNATTNPAIVGAFDLVSPLKNLPKTAWSQDVSIPNDTIFFVAANSGPQSRKARIKVYKWQGGVQHAQVFEPAPGDLIGGKDGDIDYSTGYSVVDLRDDPRSPGSTIVLVMDPTGKIQRRDYKADSTDPKQQQLQQQQATDAAAASAGATGGTPPGVAP